MIEKSFKINLSVETRETALLVQKASQYISNIRIQVGRKRVSAKSIMGIITLGNLQGEEVIISIDGKDEQEAMTEISKFFTTNLAKSDNYSY